MLNLFMLLFVGGLLALGLRQPFIWVLSYLYIDIVAPQMFTWGLLSVLPISLIAFAAAFAGWLLLDSKEGSRFTFRQGLLTALLLYCGASTFLWADYPEAAVAKWDWVWKALIFAIFLPLTLRTRLRIEATALVMVLSAAAIIINGGLKTVTGGGGYGTLNLFVDNNTGLYEGSTLSCVAVAIIPLIVWLARFGTVFRSDWKVWLFAVALIFAALLIPVGTQTRTGLLCIGVLGVLTLRATKHRFIFMALSGLAVLVAIPFLPESYTERMETIGEHEADQSASTRIAVWEWTWDYAKSHPMGGGFDAYRGNSFTYLTRKAETAGATTSVETSTVTEKGRAYHSAYFEMLGEQGFPGLILWLWLHALGLWHMEWVRRHLKKSEDPGDKSFRSLATALQNGNVIYLVGAAFTGIAFQPFIFMLCALQIGLWSIVKRRDKEQKSREAKARRAALLEQNHAASAQELPA